MVMVVTTMCCTDLLMRMLHASKDGTICMLYGHNTDGSISWYIVAWYRFKYIQHPCRSLQFDN